MTQFVFTQGEYAQYRGYVFAHHKPTTVVDRATVASLRNQPNKFKEVINVVDENAKEAPAKAEILNQHACPKCGKIVKQGKVLHVRWCKGTK